MRRATAFVTLTILVIALGGLAALAFAAPRASSTGAASSAGSLACSVKASCDTGEVPVFRMSSTANAHGGTPGGSSYGNVVCCGGVTGLGNTCSGVYDTVLTLSAADNAHAASDASYPTEACLSVGTNQAVNCTYGASCDGGWSCLATISGTTNAHVADCDGTGDYATRVCCTATTGGGPVGGIAELPDVSDSAGRNWVALAAVAAGAILALTAGAWYARRRWGR